MIDHHLINDLGCFIQDAGIPVFISGLKTQNSSKHSRVCEHEGEGVLLPAGSSQTV